MMSLPIFFVCFFLCLLLSFEYDNLQSITNQEVQIAPLIVALMKFLLLSFTTVILQTDSSRWIYAEKPNNGKDS